MPDATPIRGLPYSLGSDLAATIDDTEHSLATALDTVAMDRQGTLAARATRNPSPHAGDYDFATDDTTGHPNGTLYRYDGTAWRQVQGYVPDAAVTTAKLADAAVTPAKIAAAEAWQDVTITPGSTHYGQGNPHFQFYKDQIGIVHFRGGVAILATETIPNLTKIGTLPVGYRPPTSFIYAGVMTDEGDASPGGKQFFVAIYDDGSIYNKGVWTVTAGYYLNGRTIVPFRAEG